jgi:hypothetical protein
MIGNGYYDLVGLDETCFYGTSAAVPCRAEADGQIKELLYWLSWIIDWAEGSIEPSKAEEMRDKRQSPSPPNGRRQC